jgi:hypothetical protein
VVLGDLAGVVVLPTRRELGHVRNHPCQSPTSPRGSECIRGELLSLENDLTLSVAQGGELMRFDGVSGQERSS